MPNTVANANLTRTGYSFRHSKQNTLFVNSQNSFGVSRSYLLWDEFDQIENLKSSQILHVSVPPTAPKHGKRSDARKDLGRCMPMEPNDYSQHHGGEKHRCCCLAWAGRRVSPLPIRCLIRVSGRENRFQATTSQWSCHKKTHLRQSFQTQR